MIDLVMSSDESEAEDLGRLGHSTASAAAPAAQNRVASGRLSVGSERTPSRPVPVPLGLILGMAEHLYHGINQVCRSAGYKAAVGHVRTPTVERSKMKERKK